MSDEDAHRHQTAPDMLPSLIGAFLDAEKQSGTVDRSGLMARYPEHAESLKLFFANHDAFQKVSGLKRSDLSLPVRFKSGAEASRLSEPIEEEATLPPRSRPTGKPSAESQAMAAEKRSELAEGDGDVRYFGDYELLEEIARGGMGVVYKARQINLNRIVALKMILSGELAGDEEVQRFKSEAGAAAGLDHPGIVPIYDIGEHHGQHFYSMGFVDGQSLACHLKSGPLAPHEAAVMMTNVANAVEYAHQHGILHRDLKPANILIDAAGKPRVTDFGLAKCLSGPSDLTRTGQILGTPAYMPPEQAACRFDEMGPTSDVYSLGAILYATLTGRAPFEAANPIDTLMRVLQSEATMPTKSRPDIPQPLESICMKCLAKTPSHRYASAKELSQDLERFLRGEAILARPATVLQRVVRWGRRHPPLAAHLLAIAPTLFAVQLSHWLSGTDRAYHMRHSIVLTLWMTVAVVLQNWLDRPRWRFVAAATWCITDAAFLSVILYLAQPPTGPLLTGYAMLIVASGFLLRTALVVVTTLAAIGGYLVLLYVVPELAVQPRYCVMFVLLLTVLGGAVAAQVRRISTLNQYFEAARD